jgi:hypothetical protein
MQQNQGSALRLAGTEALSLCVQILVTCREPLGGVSGVAEWSKKLKCLSPADAAQLFYDLRPRDIALSEFGCTDPSKAGAVLSQHKVNIASDSPALMVPSAMQALMMLGGHPKRIFNAVSLLSTGLSDWSVSLVNYPANHSQTKLWTICQV